jgi:malate synthase
VAWAKAHLDRCAPWAGAAWADVQGLAVENGALVAWGRDGSLKPTLRLADPRHFAGHAGEGRRPRAGAAARPRPLLEVVVDRSTPIGAADPAGISDVVVEAALSTIMDCEDSVACVDAQDKVQAYANWLGLMRGDLEDRFEKGGRPITRRLVAPFAEGYVDPLGAPLRLRARSLMLVRNVGHLMTTPALLDRDGAEAPEGLLGRDGHRALRHARPACARGASNTATGSVYVVKPKMHGPRRSPSPASLRPGRGRRWGCRR